MMERGGSEMGGSGMKKVVETATKVGKRGSTGMELLITEKDRKESANLRHAFDHVNQQPD